MNEPQKLTAAAHALAALWEDPEAEVEAVPAYNTGGGCYVAEVRATYGDDRDRVLVIGSGLISERKMKAWDSNDQESTEGEVYLYSA